MDPQPFAIPGECGSSNDRDNIEFKLRIDYRPAERDEVIDLARKDGISCRKCGVFLMVSPPSHSALN